MSTGFVILFGIGMYLSGTLLGMRVNKLYGTCEHTQKFTLTVSNNKSVTVYMKEGDVWSW